MLKPFNLRVVICAALIALAAWPAVSRATDTQARANAKQKVVFQISDADPKKLYIVLNAAKNVQTTFGKKNALIEVVAFGPGVNLFLLESEAGQRIDAAINDGVKIVVCKNTLDSMKLTEADMLPKLNYVPGGILELMQKQKEGYAYILP